MMCMIRYTGTGIIPLQYGLSESSWLNPYRLSSQQQILDISSALETQEYSVSEAHGVLKSF